MILLGLVLDAVAQPPTLAILPFETHTEDANQAGFGAAMADMLTTDLGGHTTLRLVERSQLDAILAELDLSRSGFVEPSSIQRFGAGVGADMLLVGSLTFLDGRVRVDARVVDVESAQPVFTTDAEGSIGSLFSLERRIAHQVGARFEVEVPTATDDVPVRSLPELEKKVARHCRRGIQTFTHPLDGKLNRSISAEIDRSWRLGFAESDGEFGAGLAIVFPGVNNTPLEAGQEVRFSGPEGQVVLQARADTAPRFTTFPGEGPATIYEPQYAATEGQLQQLALFEMERVVVWVGPNWHALDIPERTRDGLRSAARCILDR